MVRFQSSWLIRSDWWSRLWTRCLQTPLFQRNPLSTWIAPYSVQTTITLSSYKGSALLPPHGWTGRGQASKTIWCDSQVKSLLLAFSHFLWYLDKHHENKIGLQGQQQRVSILDLFNHHLGSKHPHWSPWWCLHYNPRKSISSTELAKLFNQFSALVELARWDDYRYLYIFIMHAW